MNSPLPTLFVPHGAPTFALAPGAAGEALRQYAARLPRPRAVVIISPHWPTAVATVGTARQLATIHDFWGFPADLYRLAYPASGCPEAAAEVQAAIAAAGLPVAVDPARGLDHGAWVPLRFLFPEADLPVVPLSLPEGDAAACQALGRALAPLRARGFLIIGSGSITHNLRDYQLARQLTGEVPAYVRAFADWLGEQSAAGADAALIDYRRQAPHAGRAHPSEEHLLPFFIARAAAGPSPLSERFHAGVDDFVIAMDAYAFHPAPGAGA